MADEQEEHRLRKAVWCRKWRVREEREWIYAF